MGFWRRLFGLEDDSRPDLSGRASTPGQHGRQDAAPPTQGGYGQQSGYGQPGGYGPQNQDAAGPYGAYGPKAPEPQPMPSAADQIPQQGPGRQGPQLSPEDERAIAGYRYMLRTAMPDDIERVHQEAFERLTPQQRSAVLAALSDNLPEAERPASDDARTLARAATRAELRQPGALVHAFSGPSFGSVFGASMLGSVAGLAIGTAMSGALLGGFIGSPEANEAGIAGGDYGDGGYDGGGSDGGGYDGDGYDGGGYDDGGFGGFDGGDGGGFDFGDFGF